MGEEVRLKAGRPDGGSSEFQGPGKGGLARPWPSSSAKSFSTGNDGQWRATVHTRASYRRNGNNTRLTPGSLL